jgi:pimeloyl-ACP methyl ester carboxylesterase
MFFTSHLLTLPSNRALHLSVSQPSTEQPAAPPLFLIHGLGSSATAWIPALACAPQIGRRRALIAVDLAGHGLSTIDLDASLVTFANDVEHVLNQYAPGNAKFALAGHSMGGPICAELAAKFPERVEAMCTFTYF